MIDVDQLTVAFQRTRAVDELTLHIGEGEVFGFIGPNGAGKTTTIRVLATLQHPSEGSASIDGINVVSNPLEARQILGFMPDYFGVYDNLTVWEYLDYFCALYHIPSRLRQQRITDVIELVDLTNLRDESTQVLSKGVRQRLSLARTLLHNPKVLLLDEPAAGLDPRARVEFREVVKELQRLGKTILISSHILSELADMCTSLGIIEKGRLLASGSFQEIQGLVEIPQVVEMEVIESSEALLKELLDISGMSVLRSTGKRVVCEYGGLKEDLPEILRRLSDKPELGLCSFYAHEKSLEKIFMHVTRGEVG